MAQDTSRAVRNAQIRELYDASVRESAGRLGSSWLDDESGVQRAAPALSSRRSKATMTPPALLPPGRVALEVLPWDAPADSDPSAPPPPSSRIVLRVPTVVDVEAPTVRPPPVQLARIAPLPPRPAFAPARIGVAGYLRRAVVGLIVGGVLGVVVLLAAERLGAPIESTRLLVAVGDAARDLARHALAGARAFL